MGRPKPVTVKKSPEIKIPKVTYPKTASEGRMYAPTKEELRAIAWCAAQAYSTYKKNWKKVVRPAPSSLIFIKAYKYLKKSKDKVVIKYLSLINIKFENIDLEEY